MYTIWGIYLRMAVGHILRMTLAVAGITYPPRIHFENDQFPLRDMSAGNHGSSIHHLGLDICFNEYNHHDSLQTCFTEGIHLRKKDGGCTFYHNTLRA